VSSAQQTTPTGPAEQEPAGRTSSPLGPEADAARRTAPALVDGAEAAHRALFTDPGPIAPPVARGLAALAARRHGAAAIAERHARLGADPALYSGGPPADPALRAAADHVELLSCSPALARREDTGRLAAAGWSPEEIVAVSQIAAYTAFHVRLAHGLRLLAGAAGEPVGLLDRPTRGRGRGKDTAPLAANGGRRPASYTTGVLDWTPWVPPAEPGGLTGEQKASYAGKPDGPYFRLLARVPGVLRARTAVDKAVFGAREGLSRAERELAATVASKVNDCLYCASVHSRKAARISGRAEDVQRVLDAEPERGEDHRVLDAAPLSAGLEPRWAAVADFAAALSATPSAATAAQVEGLRSHGLTEAELVGLVGATAFFAWANRLMLTLGEPYLPGTAPSGAQSAASA